MAGSILSGAPRAVASAYNLAVAAWILAVSSLLLAFALHFAGA